MHQRNSFDQMAVWDGALADLDVPSRVIPTLVARGDEVLFVGASPTSEAAVHRLRLAEGALAEVSVVSPARDLGLDPAWFSVPEPMQFASGERTSHALYYPPTSVVAQGPDDSLPPLLVTIHGGPTGAALPVLSLGVQYWTSRGFGVVDVEDCAAAAQYLTPTPPSTGPPPTCPRPRAG